MRWQAANNGTNTRRYFVCKPGTLEYLRGKNGRLIRFSSFEAAATRAKALNDQPDSQANK